ncbi:2,4-dienoyl-CoA reductase [Burkholderia sp. YR290]|uniref:alkene reductase n=1 Tax=Paraburkholderia hospita TaxID=169430 RepID=UPI0009A6FF77|nr:alkene reductase [Paraburkholderia hospita]SKC98262.1 2,4-dienoyl-CoA reductase [Paraburkholderia hospita]SOE89750.1 2,4-dienoyl-CoA reductase [Burkholderia sp. YR290]
MSSLFDPYDLGPIRLKNRVVMAPMERSRARNPDWAPEADTARYFSQRAGAGLIVTGSISISEWARTWAFEPGLYTPTQIRAWRSITGEVHDHGGVIFGQIRHGGRASHVSHQPNRQSTVSSTDTGSTKAISMAFDENGQPAFLLQGKPRALRTDEVPQIVGEFAQAARNAIEGGFDGVEIHGANGYLHDQFINGTLNTRDDGYGGSIANRLRFTLETVDAVVDAIGGERIGIRLSPFGRYNEMPAFDDEADTYLTLASELSKRGIAYVHFSDQTRWADDVSIPENFLRVFRSAFRGPLILAGGYLRENGEAAIDSGEADLIGIGKPFIANPDLVERLRNGWPLNQWDEDTFYTAGAKGYTDYGVYK